jgi:hypothetical protein
MKYPSTNVGDFITLIKKFSVAYIYNNQRRHICLFRFLAHVPTVDVNVKLQGLKNITSLPRLLVGITRL